MRIGLYSLCFILLASCRQGDQKPPFALYPIGDAEEWLNDDENFGVKRYKGGKHKDSAETIFTLYNDLNNDGVRDTATAILNHKRHITEIYFSCFPKLSLNQFVEELQLTDAGDLNGDGKHEVLVLQQGSESCWDNLRLFTYNELWTEKYSGLTYQCIERPMYQFTKLNDKTISIRTFGESRDSIDAESGDTLEQVLPNEQRVHIINW